MTDLISRTDAIDVVMKHKISFTVQQDVAREIDALPSAEAETVDCTDFIRWLTETVMDDGMWELNAVAYGEVIARKLTKLGVLEVKDGYYIRHIDNNTKESDLVYRPSAEAVDVYKAHEEEHLKIVDRIKELQYAIAKTQTIVGKMVASAEAVQGEWIFNPTDAIDLMFAKPKCSKCGFESSDGGNFCPNCGAKMTKGGDLE